MALQAQTTYNLYLQNKTSCDVSVQINYCTVPGMPPSMSAPAYSTTHYVILGDPKTFEGTFIGQATASFSGRFATCFPMYINTSPYACYTEHVVPATVQPNPTTYDYYLAFY